MTTLDVAREIHKSLLAAKAVVEQRMATTPPSVRRYVHYKQLLTDYDSRIISSEETIKQLEETIVIAESEANKIKLTVKEAEQEIDETITEAVYSAVLISTSTVEDGACNCGKTVGDCNCESATHSGVNHTEGDTDCTVIQREQNGDSDGDITGTTATDSH
jgi:hypothetical protein